MRVIVAAVAALILIRTGVAAGEADPPVAVVGAAEGIRVEADVRAADRVVAIGVDPGKVGAKARAGVVRWDDIPLFSASYPRARQAILSRIGLLLAELERQRAGR